MHVMCVGVHGETTSRYCKIPAPDGAIATRLRLTHPWPAAYIPATVVPTRPEETVRAPMMIFAALLLGACAKEADEGKTADSATGAAPTPPAATADSNNATGGSGLPAGYRARLDDPSTNIADAKYTKQGDGWDVVTGGQVSHIIWAPGDTARGNFTVSTRLQQVANPAHREAYGIFVGGSNLDEPTQKYSYFVVGGTGEYLINTRDGTKVTKVRDWTKAASVPTRDASGKADNKLAIRVVGDSVQFMVNDARIATLPKSQFPTDGIAGIRIGHALHVQVQPITITR